MSPTTDIDTFPSTRRAARLGRLDYFDFAFAFGRDIAWYARDIGLLAAVIFARFLPASRRQNAVAA